MQKFTFLGCLDVPQKFLVVGWLGGVVGSYPLSCQAPTHAVVELGCHKNGSSQSYDLPLECGMRNSICQLV